MRSNKLRSATALAVLALVTVGFVTNAGIGTLSGIGWKDIVLLCPLGALGTMLAEMTMIPQAMISLSIAIVLIIIFGRAFCAWACPVPIVEKLRTLFSRKLPKRLLEEKTTPDHELEKGTVELKGCSDKKDCASCAERRGPVDSRHFILGGSLLSAAIFGFPVFCLVCPIGLSFATILLLIRLFANGDVTWSLIAVPLLLIVEVVLFKKWCHRLCPLSAMMSLVGKLNRTFRPSINDKVCIEASKGKACGVCTKVCPEMIDPRHPKRGDAWSECTKCRACVDACPAKAITMPLLAKKSSKSERFET